MVFYLLSIYLSFCSLSFLEFLQNCKNKMLEGAHLDKLAHAKQKVDNSDAIEINDKVC